MTGDQQDMLARLRMVLPTRWFPDNAPILDGVLAGLASGWAWSHALLEYVRAQTRITTASDVWLDMIAQDFFGNRIVRRNGQADNVLRSRIQRELFRERGTRGAIVATLRDLTGRTPSIFEPARTTDTGGFGLEGSTAAGLFYGMSGGWGNLNMPFECFVTAFRPGGSGIAAVSGWGAYAGGYGGGAIEYASIEMVQGQVTDDDIFAAVAVVLPVATIGWTRITN